MNNFKWRSIVLCIGLALSAGSTFATAQQPIEQAAAKQGQNSGTVDQLEHVLSWLPLETETLAVMRCDVLMSGYNLEAPAADSAAELLAALYAIPAMPLYVLKKGRYAKPLAGKKLRFVVEASCQFRMVPQGPVAISVYKGCHLFVFDEDLGPVGDALKKSLMEEARATETLRGHSVAKFTEPISEADNWTYFVALPRKNVLLIATDREYLDKLLERMERPPEVVAFPANSPDRKQVEPGACFFAIRRSISNKQDAPQAPPEFVCSYLPNKQGEIKLYYFMKGPLIADAFHSWRIDENFGVEPPIQPSLRRVSPDIVEVSLRLDRQETAPAFWLLLFVALGHAVTI